MTIREGRLTLQPVSIAWYESIIQQFLLLIICSCFCAGPVARSAPSHETDYRCRVWVCHVPRPRNLRVASITCIGRFPCEPPQAILTRLAPPVIATETNSIFICSYLFAVRHKSIKSIGIRPISLLYINRLCEAAERHVLTCGHT